MKRKYLHAVHQCLNCGEKYERIASREGFDGCPECRSKRKSTGRVIGLLTLLKRLFRRKPKAVVIKNIKYMQLNEEIELRKRKLKEKLMKKSRS